MSEYIYADKEWDVKVGDVCESRDKLNEIWIQSHIIALGNPFSMITEYKGAMHTIRSEGSMNPKRADGYWMCRTPHLRKLRPPEQKDSKRAESFDLFINKILEPAKIKRLEEMES